MSKKWVDMTREELLAERGAWEGKLQTVNLELTTAKRRAAATGQFMALDDLHALEERRLRFAAGLRTIQSELSRKKAQAPQDTFESLFEEEAYEMLAPALYDEIAAKANQRLREKA